MADTTLGHGGKTRELSPEELASWAQRFAELLRENDRLMRSYVRSKRTRAGYRPLPERTPTGSDLSAGDAEQKIVADIFRRGGIALIQQYHERFEARVNALKATAARRTGDPDITTRRQRRSEWEADYARPTPPHAGSPLREWARSLSTQDYPYAYVVWLCAGYLIMGHPPLETGVPFSRRVAYNAKRVIDQVWKEAKREPPTPLPRGWWKTNTEGTLIWYPIEMVVNEH